MSITAYRSVTPPPRIAVEPRPSSAGVRCRPIRRDDRDALARLLTVNFPTRDHAYWQQALDKLEHHTETQGFPHFGYVLQAGNDLVGVLLMIFARSGSDGRVRCNLSSWCVGEAYRSFAPLLVTMATRDKAVTYFNISPERATRPMVEAQGFTRYADGLYAAVPLLLAYRGLSARLQDAAEMPAVSFSAEDAAILQGHADLNCLKAWCVTKDRAFPLIFVPTSHLRGKIRAAHVVYCPDTTLLQKYAGPIGRYLARHGIGVLTFDANAAVAGLPGCFFPDRMPKYFKGPDRPRLGDLAFTELPMFGI